MPDTRINAHKELRGWTVSYCVCCLQGACNLQVKMCVVMLGRTITHWPIGIHSSYFRGCVVPHHWRLKHGNPRINIEKYRYKLVAIAVRRQLPSLGTVSVYVHIICLTFWNRHGASIAEYLIIEGLATPPPMKPSYKSTPT